MRAIRNSDARQDGKPGRVGWNVQVEIEETVHEHSTTTQGSAEANPRALSASGKWQVASGEGGSRESGFGVRGSEFRVPECRAEGNAKE